MNGTLATEGRGTAAGNVTRDGLGPDDHRGGEAQQPEPVVDLLVALVHAVEHEVVAGLDHAADLLLAPFAIDFRGWTMGDQRNETWM